MLFFGKSILSISFPVELLRIFDNFADPVEVSNSDRDCSKTVFGFSILHKVNIATNGKYYLVWLVYFRILKEIIMRESDAKLIR